MPKYREMTSSEIGRESGLVLAETIGTLHAELIKKGMDKKIVENIIDKVAGAASSHGDGHCEGLVRTVDLVSNPGMPK
jgi:hypothetical protein